MTYTASRRVPGGAIALWLASSACGGSSGGDGAPVDVTSEERELGPDGPDGSGEPSASERAGSGGGVEASSGCYRAPASSSGEGSIEVDGVTRTYILDVPSGYDESTPHPLLFGFHGRGFSGAEFRDASYGDLLSAAGGSAIVVHPDALGEPERAWDTESLDDVRFFDALLEELSDGLCVDESRVFAAGHSSGGYFVNLLACERADRLRAIAPVAGGGPFGSDGEAPSCTGPVSAWIAHAEDDETVLFDNGENSRDYWVDSGSCDEDSVDEVSPAPCVAYDGCEPGVAVRWCEYSGGHDWPSFGASGLWSFFERL